MKRSGHRIIAVGALFCLAACGRKGALIYPDMLVPASPTAVVAYQSGASVKVQANLPDNDRAGRKLLDLAGVRISRQVSDSDQDQVCPSCLEDYRLFRILYLDLLPESTQRHGNRLLFLDGEVSEGKTYSYSIVPFTKAGVAGSASPPASTAVVPALLPPVLQAESFPTEIKLTFAGQPPRDGTIIGYNLYRTTTKGLFSQFPINRELLNTHAYLDSGLLRGTRYYYSARSVVQLASGAQIESMASKEAEGMLKDDE